MMRTMISLRARAVIWAVALAAAAGVSAQDGGPVSSVEPRDAAFDTLLDLYVRDGLVYYRALKSTGATVERYVRALDVDRAAYDAWSREQQLAFWINAYNALVIQTVLDRYPIRGSAPDYPANSIRQIPGAFDRTTHRVAGERLTLDAIETTKVATFGDPRAFLALGRGSVGGGRLLSAAYTASRLDEQLARTAAECVTRQECARIDVSADALVVTPIFSWRRAEFEAALGQEELSSYPGRSPIERAILRLLSPHFLPGERQPLSRNSFAIRYGTYDWRLNDLTGGPPTR